MHDLLVVLKDRQAAPAVGVSHRQEIVVVVLVSQEEVTGVLEHIVSLLFFLVVILPNFARQVPVLACGVVHS